MFFKFLFYVTTLFNIIVCEADLEVLMLFVSQSVSQLVVMLKIVTEWLSDQVAKWPSDWVTKWLSDIVIEWRPNDRVTGSFADDWPDGIFQKREGFSSI